MSIFTTGISVFSTGISGGRPLTNIPERLADENEMYKRMLDNQSAKIRVAIPAQVVSFDPTKQTIVAQPLIREKMIDRATGEIQWYTLPPFPDVPVQYPQGGNFVLTMPVTAGDEVLLVFQDMSFDSWWASGGIQNWVDRRRHDLSDAIAILGINSVPNVIKNISSNATELRAKDGSLNVSLQDNRVAGTGTVTATVTAGKTSIPLFANAASLQLSQLFASGAPVTLSDTITLSATNVNINGNLIHNGFNYVHHVHGVTTAPGTTAPVTEVP